MQAGYRIALTLALASMAGCSVMQAARDDEMDRTLAVGDYRGSALLAEKRLGFTPASDGSLPPVAYRPADVLDHLDAAEAWRMAGDADRAIAQYDAAEEALKGVELENFVAQGARQAAAVLGNDLALDYVPSPAEAVLINYYKALAFWKKGDADNVRVELNRADDRIRRSVERYQREIAEASDAAEQQRAHAGRGLAESIEAKFPEMAKWQPYASFVMPQASYLQALFLARSAIAGDRAKAEDLYVRVAGIVGDNPAVAQDLAEAAKGRVCPQDDCVWVLVEQGLGPTLVEARFDLPLSSSDGMMIVSLALPMLTSRDSADGPDLSLSSGSAPVILAELASMDRVLQTEFNKRFPAILTRALLSATLKAAMQKQVNDKAGDMAGFMGAIMSLAVTSADTRMWRSMPGRFYLARVHKNAGPLEIRTAAGVIPITLPQQGSQLIHIKAPIAGLMPSYEVLPL